MGVAKGLIWADGFLTLPDESGCERLVCHYAHMQSLAKMLGHGLAVFNDEKSEFERLKTEYEEFREVLKEISTEKTERMAELVIQGVVL